MLIFSSFSILLVFFGWSVGDESEACNQFPPKLFASVRPGLFISLLMTLSKVGSRL